MNSDARGHGNPDGTRLADAHRELQNLLLDDPGVTEFLDNLAKLIAALVPGASCGITTRRDHELITVANSDELAALVDEVQYHRGRGPCLQTLHSGARVIVDDLVDDTRWGAYNVSAIAAGVRSSVSLPLTIGDTTRGAVNVYGPTPHRFGSTEVHLLEAFTQQAAIALTLLLRHTEQATLDDQLQEALVVRAMIDQALGIVMAQNHLNSTQAFELLRQTSQNSNRKLSAIAAELITSVTGQPPEPPRRIVPRSR